MVGGSPAHAAAHAQMFYSLVIQQTYQNMCAGVRKRMRRDK